ncbi:MAG: DegT/DnrJ/EryC1/StrS family aminotransferase, partial [Candidatus Eremiobacteraeota bacterium]|nr:DegT/DnrJ/EryC1/StrS family aminotransferase [Candidatus Eremiobacteraeota bacterium]
IAGFETPKNRNAEGHVYHLYVTQVRDRDRVRDELASRGIATGIHYPVPIHLQPAYADLGILPGRFPVTETAARRILSLPMYPELEANQIRHVVDTLREVAEPALRLRATVA